MKQYKLKKGRESWICTNGMEFCINGFDKFFKTGKKKNVLMTVETNPKKGFKEIVFTKPGTFWRHNLEEHAMNFAGLTDPVEKTLNLFANGNKEVTLYVKVK